MFTKTGELLMRKKNQKTDNSKNRMNIVKQDSIGQYIRPQEREYRRQRNISHVAHLNQYNFICVSNKSNHELQVSKQILKQLQIQNFRLIQQNMKLVEWSKTFLLKTKQRLLRTIQGIEDFRYLQSVNKLYQLVGQLTEYEQTGFQVPKFSNKEHYLNLTKLQNPQSKKIVPAQFQMRNLVNFTYIPIEKKPKADIPIKEEQEQKEAVLIPNFLNLKMPDYSEYQATQGQQHLFNMLMLQSLCIQTFVEQNMR